MDSAVHRINHYPVDSSIGFAGVYPLDSDLSGGQRYPSFEQLGPGVQTYFCITTAWLLSKRSPVIEVHLIIIQTSNFSLRL